MDDRLIRIVAGERAQVAMYKAELVRLEEAIAASDLGVLRKLYQDMLAAHRQAESDAALELAQVALAEFNETGGKHPHPAITIKEMTRLEYSLEDAHDWAVRSMPNLLKLDTRGFEKVAKAAGLDFVAISTEPQVTVARDLSEYAE